MMWQGMNVNGPARPVCRMVPADDDATNGHRNEKEKENAGSLIHEFNHLPGREGFAALTAPHQEIHFPGDGGVYGRKINDATNNRAARNTRRTGKDVLPRRQRRPEQCR
ncbi:hypothetical protein ACLBOM_36545 [Escherichia coli]